jgi:hypothetical protein
MDALAPNPAHVPDPFAVTSLEELARHYDPPRELVLRKVIHRLEPKAMAFIAASPFAVLATVGPEGVHATPRGDAPGFIRPLDDRTLALPDRRGNNRLDALRDIIANPAVALLFLVPGAGEALRVNGTARITADPALRERFAERGRLPATVVLIEMREAYLQCAKAVLRSRLWGDRGRPETVPSMGEMIAAHTGGMVDPATYDREAPQRLVDTMY